jgi:HSP20 family protein
MDLVRWDPFREMTSLRDAMERLFEDSFVRPSRFWPDQLGRGELPIDMY